MQAEDIKKININNICSVESFIKDVNGNYMYEKESTSKETIKISWFKKMLGKKERVITRHYKEGFYTLSFSDSGLRSKEEIEKYGTSYCEGETVFYKPYLQVKTTDQNTHHIFFQDKEALMDFTETEEMKKVNWINGRNKVN